MTNQSDQTNQPPKFAVELSRTYYATVIVYVEAPDAEHAESFALERAAEQTDGLDWSTPDAALTETLSVERVR